MEIEFKFKVDRSVYSDDRLLEFYQDYDDWSENELLEYASFLLYIATTKKEGNTYVRET